jgi:hypothetical protein
MAGSLGAVFRLTDVSKRYSATGGVVLIDAMVMAGLFVVGLSLCERSPMPWPVEEIGARRRS